MTNYTKLYWLTRLDSINTMVTLFCFISVVAFVVWHAVPFFKSDFDWGEDEIDKYKKENSWIKKLAVWVGLISFIILTFIPSQKDVMFIIAGGKTIDFIQSDTSLSKIPSQTTAIVTKFLDEQLKEIK